MIEIKAPEAPIFTGMCRKSIFLAGSIEMGKAENWQDQIIKELKDIRGLIIYNPRRDDWDSSWEQSIDNPQFYEQVIWELDNMQNVDWIPIYFSPETKSPITLLELGLFVFSKKLIVCCPEGFWRKGNVDIVCRRFGIEQVATFDELVANIKEKINQTV